MCETMFFEFFPSEIHSITVIVRTGNVPDTDLLYSRLGRVDLDWLGDVEGRNSIDFKADQHRVFGVLAVLVEVHVDLV